MKGVDNVKLEQYKFGKYVKINDYRAFNYDVEGINEWFPVYTRLIREIHSLFMQGVRGEGKIPGEIEI